MVGSAQLLRDTHGKEKRTNKPHPQARLSFVSLLNSPGCGTLVFGSGRGDSEATHLHCLAPPPPLGPSIRYHANLYLTKPWGHDGMCFGKPHPYQFGFRYTIDKRLCSGLADTVGRQLEMLDSFVLRKAGERVSLSFFFPRSIFPYYNCKRTGVFFGWFRRLSSVSVPSSSSVEAEGARPR